MYTHYLKKYSLVVHVGDSEHWRKKIVFTGIPENLPWPKKLARPHIWPQNWLGPKNWHSLRFGLYKNVGLNFIYFILFIVIHGLRYAACTRQTPASQFVVRDGILNFSYSLPKYIHVHVLKRIILLFKL